MILVTGASGKTGQAVIRAVAATGQIVRAFVRRLEQIDVVKRAGAQEADVGDLGDRQALLKAVRGVQAIYHICPNVNPDEQRISELLLEAARSAGVERFVYHSVLHPQAEAMPHHWSKLRVEELLFESGLPFTVLQPTAYMQNILASWQTIVTEGRLRNPYPVETKISLVDLADVAEVAAKVLAEAGRAHAGATYELVGTPALTQTQVAETISEALGRPVRAEAESIETWEARTRAAGMAEYQRETLIKMFRYYGRHGLVGNPNTLRWLLGREPMSLTEFARWAAEGQPQRQRAPRYCEG